MGIKIHHLKFHLNASIREKRETDDFRWIIYFLVIITVSIGNDIFGECHVLHVKIEFRKIQLSPKMS